MEEKEFDREEAGFEEDLASGGIESTRTSNGRAIYSHDSIPSIHSFLSMLFRKTRDEREFKYWAIPSEKTTSANARSGFRAVAVACSLARSVLASACWDREMRSFRM
jgi:hypothetical protein